MNWIRSLLVALGLMMIAVTVSPTAQAQTPDAQGPALVAVSSADAAEPAAGVLACELVNYGVGSRVAHFTLYWFVNHVGRCATFYHHASCTIPVDNRDSIWDLTSHGWSNVSESVRVYNNCAVRLYDASHCPSQGVQSGWIPGSSDLGTWRNKASCVLVS